MYVRRLQKHRMYLSTCKNCECETVVCIAYGIGSISAFCLNRAWNRYIRNLTNFCVKIWPFMSVSYALTAAFGHKLLKIVVSYSSDLSIWLARMWWRHSNNRLLLSGSAAAKYSFSRAFRIPEWGYLYKIFSLLIILFEFPQRLELHRQKLDCVDYHLVKTASS